MTNFSGAIKLADLNDFIAPSQSCVVNLGDLKEKPLPQDIPESGVSLRSKPPKGGWSQTLPTQSEADPVKISLQDCLACSGCVTSAETVLLEHQSTAELSSKLRDSDTAVVITLSRQSIASLATACRLSPKQVLARLSTCLRDLGAKAVLDAGTGQELALMEAAAEFLERYRCKHSQAEGSAAAQQRCDSGSTASFSGRPSMEDIKPSKKARTSAGALPMLASACPGWICYAEKTHGDYVLPYISSAKSPQAMMGTLVKRYWAPRNNCQPSAIYHCAVMPCFDKKLEASRDDFNLPGTQIPETDSVLTTTELRQLLDQQGLDLSRVAEEEPDTILGGRSLDMAGVAGGSGGYMEYIYRVAAWELFGVRAPEGPLPMKAIRNTDFKEVLLEVDGRIVLRFALAYGFRNIQTVLRKIKMGLSQYDYIEVMACPSGCINGGGQMPPGKGSLLQSHVQDVDNAYHHPQVGRQAPEESSLSQALYRSWVQAGPMSRPAKDAFHTEYHKRDKSLAAAVKDW